MISLKGDERHALLAPSDRTALVAASLHPSHPSWAEVGEAGPSRRPTFEGFGGLATVLSVLGTNVTYFEDGSAYTYGEGEDLINVGWLERSHPYETGPVPDGFVDRLAELCRQPVARTRGFHSCGLCGRDPESWPWWTVVPHQEGDVRAGSAEVRVESPSGTRMAAPDMILHYVTEHGYQPPDAFIDAVLHGRPLDS